MTEFRNIKNDDIDNLVSRIKTDNIDAAAGSKSNNHG